MRLRLRRQRFGSHINLVEIVLVGKKEVAHHLKRHRPQRRHIRAAIAQLQRQRFQPLGGFDVAPVQRQQRAPDGGHLRGDFAQLGQGDGLAARVVNQRLLHRQHQARFLVFGELLHVHPQHAADFEQHRHGERALVLLQLIEVTGRQTQQLRHRHLRQAALHAQGAQAHAHEGFFH